MKRSYLLITFSLVAVVMLALAAGCTGNGKTTPVATTVPTPSPTVVATIQAPVSTTAASGNDQGPGLNGSEADHQDQWFNNRPADCPEGTDECMASHPDADIQVSGGGSGVGIQAIGAKTVDIGMTSREVTKAEMTEYPTFVVTTVAQDGIAVIVNPVNEIRFITIDQVRDIYLGKITKWTQITGANVPNTNNQIVIIGRDSASGYPYVFR